MKVIWGAIVCSLALASCGEPVTRGEVRDRQLAMDTERCAEQYLGRANSGPNAEIWIMCVQITAKQGTRDAVGVANRVIINRGWNVFEFEAREGATNTLSDAGSARISSGQ